MQGCNAGEWENPNGTLKLAEISNALQDLMFGLA